MHLAYHNMALLLPVKFEGADGGLRTLLADARVPPQAIEWIVGDGANHLGCEHITDFMGSFGAKTFEEEIETRLKEAQLPEVKDSQRRD